jgi:XapX domain-containing protein
MKLVVGLILGAGIGMGCRVFAIPLPGPNAVLGALLGIAMATGYELTDKVLSRRAREMAPDSSTGASVGVAPESAASQPPTR